jgi:dienelactone hydrolase
MASEPGANRYVRYMRHIRWIQEHLLLKAAKRCVPALETSNVDRAVGVAHLTVVGRVFGGRCSLRAAPLVCRRTAAAAAAAFGRCVPPSLSYRALLAPFCCSLALFLCTTPPPPQPQSMSRCLRRLAKGEALLDAASGTARAAHAEYQAVVEAVGASGLGACFFAFFEEGRGEAGRV